MSLNSKIESILFVASKPLAIGKIAKALVKNEAEVEEAIENLILKYNGDNSGIHILKEGKEVQMTTNANNAEIVEGFVKSEVSGELTKAQLETLTVIAYRAPITRPELEQIRGVNCSLIIRNLLVRGLITETEDADKFGMVYSLSMNALAHLGITDKNELPNFEELSKHEHIENTINEGVE